MLRASKVNRFRYLKAVNAVLLPGHLSASATQTASLLNIKTGAKGADVRRVPTGATVNDFHSTGESLSTMRLIAQQTKRTKSTHTNKCVTGRGEKLVV